MRFLFSASRQSNAPTASVATHRYDAISQALHWFTVALVVVQFVLIDVAGDIPRDIHSQHALAYHKGVGVSILILTVVRLTWRATHRPPPLPKTMPGYQRTLAHLMHGFLYGFLFALPITGLLMSSAVDANSTAAIVLTQTHDALGAGLFFFILAHGMAALKHHWRDKDDTLRRMLPLSLLKKTRK